MMTLYHLFFSLFLISFTICVQILEQNVGILTSKFGCGGSYCRGSMCLVEQEITLSNNIQKNEPFDLIFLCEVMDSRDCPKIYHVESTSTDKICTCDKYPKQQQIDRLVSSQYTKLCDGHRSCLAVNSKFANVSSCPAGSTCMNGLNYQKLPNCSNPQVPASGISYVDMIEYESGMDIRVILYHPIAYQGCFVESCFFQYFQIMEKLFMGKERVIIAGDFNFDMIRLINLVQMDAFWYYQNLTKKYEIEFFNSHYPEISDLPIATEVGLFTLDWIGSNFYKYGKCKNMNKMEERMDYPVLSFDHRGQICELEKEKPEKINFNVEENSHDHHHHHHLKNNPSVQDILGSLVEYSEIFLKNVYNSSPMHIKLFDIEFWYNITNTWANFPFGMPVLNQYAISTQSLYFWTNNLFADINGTIEIHLFNSILKKHSERGTIIAKLVLDEIKICATFCNDIFEPICFKKNQKKKNPFCQTNSTCPSKYNTTVHNYMQITNVEVKFDRKKSEMYVENISTSSEFIKKVISFILTDMKDVIFEEIETSVVSFVKGKVFLIPVSS